MNDGDSHNSHHAELANNIDLLTESLTHFNNAIMKAEGKQINPEQEKDAETWR